MPVTGEVTRDQALQVARKAIDVFARSGFGSCLVGGVACALYGNSRCPADVDLVVLDSLMDQEALKRLLCQKDPTFYLCEPRTYGATYKVLWAHVGAKSCKVDVLMPGIMNIPHIPVRHIVKIDGFPVMPLLPLLLLKLQAWTDHQVAARSYLRMKQYTDQRDAEQLVRIAVQRGETVDSIRWLPEDFLGAGKGRVLRFVGLAPTSRQDFRALGFAVPKR